MERIKLETELDDNKEYKRAANGFRSNKTFGAFFASKIKEGAEIRMNSLEERSDLYHLLKEDNGVSRRDLKYAWTQEVTYSDVIKPRETLAFPLEVRQFRQVPTALRK